MDKTTIALEKETVNRLIKLKRVGDSYDDIITRLIDGHASRV